MLNVIMLTDIMLSAILPSVIVLTVIMLSAIMPSVIMMSLIKLSVLALPLRRKLRAQWLFKLNGNAECHAECHYAECHYAECH
jgi:hypothetical protein